MNTAERITDALIPSPRCTAAEAAKLIDECAAELRRAAAAITVQVEELSQAEEIE